MSIVLPMLVSLVGGPHMNHLPNVAENTSGVEDSEQNINRCKQRDSALLIICPPFQPDF